MSTVTLFDAARYNSDLKGIQLWNGWQISSSKNDDVIWNIVFAYLNSFSISDENELIQRMDLITGNGKVNRNFKNFLEKCNPFLHGEKMSDIIDEFKGRVEVDMKDEFQEESKNFRYLNASSKMLSCNIVLISSGAHGKTVITVFPVPLLGNPRTIFSNHILIINKFISVGENESQQENFSFCIPKEIGIERKRQALAEILKETRMVDSDEKMATEISLLPDITDHFLTSLLKNGFKKAVPFIYESPNVLSKLADAGFETDPRRKDSAGKSAFFHALKTEESQLVFLLFDHVFNFRLQIDASSDQRSVKEHLNELKSEELLKQFTEKSKCILEYLCRLYEFQSKIGESLRSINLYHTNDKKFETSLRKKAILLILETYKCYFDYTSEELCIDADDISRFKEFYEHKDYFDKLDLSLALIFFDHLYLLKERLQLPSKAYLNIESSFYLFISCRDYLKEYEKDEKYCLFSRWVAFQERLSLQRQMCSFKEILEKIRLPNGPETEVRTLINLPQVYGEFLVLRLKHYFKVTNTVQFALVPVKSTAMSSTGHDDQSKSFKSILAIERCLHVLGECCKDSDFQSFQKIISLALPEDCKKLLKRIRNYFTHAKPHQLLYRDEVEKDEELYKDIKKELGKLEKFLMPIYSAQKHEIEKFWLLHCVKSVCKSQGKFSSAEQEKQWEYIIPSPETEVNQSCKILDSNWKLYFYNMFSFLSEKINDEDFNKSILSKNVTTRCKRILRNLISAVRGILKKLKVNFTAKAVEELDRHFWCLENILTWITTDRNLAKYRGTLLLMLEDRKSHFTHLEEHAKQFQTINKTSKRVKMINKSTNTIIEETTIEEDEIDHRHLPSEPEGPLGGNPIDDYELDGTIVDTDSENFESLLHLFDDTCSISQETVDGTEFEEYPDLLRNAGDLEEAIPFNQNDSSSTKENGVTSCDECLQDDASTENHDYPDSSETENYAEIKEVVKNNLIERVKTLLDVYEKIANTLFDQYSDDSTENLDFKSIQKYCSILEGCTSLKDEEKNLILQSVPIQFQNVPDVKKTIKDLSERAIELTKRIEDELFNLNLKNNFEEIETYIKLGSDHIDHYYSDLNKMMKEKAKLTKEIEEEISKLNLKNKEIKEIKENISSKLIDEVYQIIDPVRDYFSILKVRIESKEIDEKECELLCTNLKIPEDAKDILMKLVPGQSKKVPGNHFEFLQSRIKMLKKILIEENSVIQELWEKATTPRRKRNVKEKIIDLYLNDFEIQASIETLLFDCMVLLCSNKLKKLWKKTKKLFNGTSLRNVLAHSHPLLESLGRLLDPCDLPSELVEKILQLISDKDVLDCMQKVLNKSETHLNGFKRIMNGVNDKTLMDLREEILKCDRWHDYATLIPVCKGECKKCPPLI